MPMRVRSAGAPLSRPYVSIVRPAVITSSRPSGFIQIWGSMEYSAVPHNFAMQTICRVAFPYAEEGWLDRYIIFPFGIVDYHQRSWVNSAAQHIPTPVLLRLLPLVRHGRVENVLLSVCLWPWPFSSSTWTPFSVTVSKLCRHSLQSLALPIPLSLEDMESTLHFNH